jgi:hypothetical protein
MSQLKLDVETLREPLKDVAPRPTPKAEPTGRRLCISCLAVLLVVSCVVGVLLMIWSYQNEKDSPRLLYAISPVTFLLFSGLVQLLLLGIQGPQSKQRADSDVHVRQLRINPQLLAVGFVLGVCVSLLHTFGTLIGRIAVLPLATSRYQVIHEGILAALAVGMVVMLGFLAHRVSHLDD